MIDFTIAYFQIILANVVLAKVNRAYEAQAKVDAARTLKARNRVLAIQAAARRSRIANRPNRARGKRPVRQAADLAFRKLRSVKSAANAKRQSRKTAADLAKAAAKHGTQVRAWAIARPEQWCEQIANRRYGMARYASTNDHDPDNYLETTTLMNFITTTPASVSVEQEETTTLLMVAPTSAAPAPAVTVTVAKPIATPEVVVNVDVEPNTTPTLVEIWKGYAKTGTAGMLANLDTLQKSTGKYPLWNGVLTCLLGVRGQSSQPYQLPPAVESLLTAKVKAIVPECVWQHLPGATQLAELVGSFDVPLEGMLPARYLTIESFSSRATRSDSVRFDKVGEYKDVRGAGYNEVISALKVTNRAGKNRQPIWKGYNQRACKHYTKLVVNLMRLAYVPGLHIVVPNDVLEAVELFLSCGGNEGKPLAIAAKFVGIGRDWLLPLSGLDYDLVESAFERLEMSVEAGYIEKVAGLRPFTYTKLDKGYTIKLGGGSEFFVNPGIGSRPARVYHRPAGSLGYYFMRPFVAGPIELQGECDPTEVVRLSSLDALWYAFECYGFAGLNRANENRKKTALDKAGNGEYISRFVVKQMPVEFKTDMSGDIRSNRDTYEDNKLVMCAVAMPLPFEIERTKIDYDDNYQLFKRKARLVPNGAYTQHSYSNITGMYNAYSTKASVVSERVAILAMTKAINIAHDLALVPTGTVGDCIEQSLVAVSYHKQNLAAAKRNLIATLEALWVNAKFDKTLGAFDRNNTAQHVEAFWSKADVANAMQALGITKADANGAKAAAFWEVLAKIFKVALSNKGSKVMKRVIMTYSQVCEAEGQEVIGFKTADGQENKAVLVPSAVLPNLLGAPGMGLVEIDAIKARYSTKEQVANETLPASCEVAYVQLTDEFAAIATELTVTDEADRMLVGWSFPEKTLVEADTVLGRVVFSSKDGGETPYSLLLAGTKGMLGQVLYNTKTLVGGERKIYAFAKIKCQVTNTLKLRSTIALKLNALPVKMWRFLSIPYAKQQINKPECTGVKMLVYGDSYKGSDNITALVKLAAVNACKYERFAQLVIDTNHKVQDYLEQERSIVTDYIWVDAGAIVAGVYAELVAAFELAFSTDVWHYEQTPVADMAKVRVAHTRNRAVATQMLAEYPNAKLKGQPWRFVSSAEAKAYLQIPGEVIFDIEVAEKAGTYTNNVVPVGTAYVVTNAVGEIGITDNISVAWSTTDKNGVVHYRMLDRSYGWGPNGDLQLLFPVEVESTTIPQALAKTSVMPFALVQHALEGNSGMVENHLERVRANANFDGLLSSMLDGKDILTEEGTGVFDLTVDKAMPAVTFGPGSEELLAQLSDAETYTSDTAFFTALAKACSNCIFRIPLLADGTKKLTLHLGTLLNWSKGSLESSGESALKSICAWFKAWIVRGQSPYSEESVYIAQSIHRQLAAYYNGKGHMKGMLRGQASVYTKVAACSLVPGDELWISWVDAKHYARVFGVENLEGTTHVSYRRMPMFNSNISKIRVLTRDEVNFYRKEYGVLFAAKLAYIGVVQMYSNFGDLDGDAIEICDVTKEASAGLCVAHNFDTIATMLADLLKHDVFAWEYWLSDAADQYIADHFFINGYAKSKAKGELSWDKNCTTLNKFADFQIAAGAVQTVTVGLTYKVATLTLMFAEILPIVWDKIVSLNDGVTPVWLQAFSWVRDRSSATLTIASLIQLYEVALGGYDADMAKVTLGYLTRSMNCEVDCDITTPVDIAAGITGGPSSTFDNVVPTKDGFRRFKHLPVNEVEASLTNMGFCSSDLGKFKDCFMLAGLCVDYSRKPDKFEGVLPEELVCIFNIIQTILDVTQVKLLGVDGRPLAYDNYRITLNALTEATKSSALEVNERAQGLLWLDEVILTETVSGKLFAAYHEVQTASLCSTTEYISNLPLVS